jgi:hypothetical protein
MNMKVSFTGWNSEAGKTIIDTSSSSLYSSLSSNSNTRRIEGEPMAIFLLLIPAALFAAFQFKSKFSFVVGRLYQVSTGLSGFGLIALLIYSSSVGNEVKDVGKGLVAHNFTFWYFLSLLLYVAAGFISAKCALTLKNSPSKHSADQKEQSTS